MAGPAATMARPSLDRPVGAGRDWACGPGPGMVSSSAGGAGGAAGPADRAASSGQVMNGQVSQPDRLDLQQEDVGADFDEPDQPAARVEPDRQVGVFDAVRIGGADRQVPFAGLGLE